MDQADGRVTAERLADAADSPEIANALARRHVEGRERGVAWLRGGRTPSTPLSSLLVDGASVPTDVDGAAFFLALLLETSRDERRIPKQVLVYEATRLELTSETPDALRALVEAGRALTLARAGYCGLARDAAGRSRGTELELSELQQALARWLGPGGLTERLDAPRVQRDLTHSVAVLAGAAEACCEVREGDESASARSIEGWIEHADALGVSAPKLAILRAYTALVSGDLEVAREQIAALPSADLAPDDAERYRLMRDAASRPSRREQGDSMSHLLDRQWLSSLALAGVAQAVREDGLLDALDARPEVGAVRRLAAGEVAVIAAARERYPVFDQTHQMDRSAMERVAELFR